MSLCFTHFLRSNLLPRLLSLSTSSLRKKLLRGITMERKKGAKPHPTAGPTAATAEQGALVGEMRGSARLSETRATWEGGNKGSEGIHEGISKGTQR